jgi:1-acyl-sn-glycerol-3-phosphate acyltransferase
MKKFYAFLLRLLGWKSVLPVPIPPKCVICVAPHTSNRDFFIGLIFAKSIIGNPYFLMKKDWFFFPLGFFLKRMGGIPVNRKKKTFLSEQMVELFDSRERFYLAIAPEGTRKKNVQWKSGFYYIASCAHVPITLAYIDYKQKEIGVFDNFYPAGNAEKDIETIKQYYKHVAGKNPNGFVV